MRVRSVELEDWIEHKNDVVFMNDSHFSKKDVTEADERSLLCVGV